MDDGLKNRLGGDRITSRQIDELIGIARGIAADGTLNQPEVEFLQKWLAANQGISDQPVIGVLYRRINEVLRDNQLDSSEARELLDTLNALADRDFELGEVLKSSSLPLCSPAPKLSFAGVKYCFTGTFNFGQRKACEKAVFELGAEAGSLTQKTNVLVIGAYATESWKHSSFGNKIISASEWRENGLPISIVSEEHWVSFL
jgi:NAD-dependent DNA ligase